MSSEGAVPLLIETEWLAERMDDPGVVVVDARRWAQYLVGHIPRSVSFPMRKVFDESYWGPGHLPPQEEMCRLLGEAGLSREEHLVLYDDGDGLAASRVFWALDFLGHPRASLLNGGFAKWSYEGRERSLRKPDRTPTTYQGSAIPRRLASSDWIHQQLEEGRDPVIIDCRSVEEYTGARRKSARGGHIPGAVHVEWTKNLRETGSYPTFRSREELEALYQEVGASDGQAVVTYCQAQVRGAHTYFVLRLLGLEAVKSYEGSWAEWGNDPKRPVVQGAEPGGIGEAGGG